MATRLAYVILLLSIAGLSLGPMMTDGFDWDVSPPTDCPHENLHTHMCSIVVTANATCVNIYQCKGVPGELATVGDHLDYSWCMSFVNCAGYRCEKFCCDGWTTDSYGRCVEETGRIQCMHGGTILSYYDGFRCVCSRNFTGKHCETPICRCENGGICDTDYLNRNTCQCSPGFTGAHCEHATCTKMCQNGGSCVTDGTRQYCICSQFAAGDLCENLYVNDKECPLMNHGSSLLNTMCSENCYGNDDCYGDSICCSYGCDMFCKRPVSRTCEFEGGMLAVGTVFKLDDCQTCNCSFIGEVVCSTVNCRSPPWCLDGAEPVYTPGECCKTCPDYLRRPSPKFEKCPYILELEVMSGSNRAVISDSDRTKFSAYDYNGTTLEVTFNRYSFELNKACMSSSYFNTTATVVDDLGRKATCSVYVAVADPYPPIMTCKEDVYVFKDQFVKVVRPTVTDNVGVSRYWSNSEIDISEGSHLYPVGRHSVSFTAADCQYNTATCLFFIHVSSRDTPFEDLPLGLRQTNCGNMGGLPIAAIVAPVAAAILVITCVIILVLCVRRRRMSKHNNQPSVLGNNTIAQARAPRQLGHNDAFDNNIYSVYGTPDMTLPAYTPPIHPPSYDNMNGGEYSYIAPPAYEEMATKEGGGKDNDGYEEITWVSLV